MREQMGRRLLWLSLMGFVIWAGMAVRLYQVQLAQGPEFARMAHNQRTLALPVSGSRGLILDRYGKPLHDPQAGWGVALFPPLVTDAASTSRTLASLVGGTSDQIMQALLRGRDPFWLTDTFQTSLPDATARQIQQLRLPGVVVAPVGNRYGPGASARHLVGYIDANGGVQGLEKTFESELSGEAIPQLVAYLNGTGTLLDDLGIRTVVPSRGKPPYDLHTTIDGGIQRAVEEVLDAYRHPDGGQMRGAVVVLDPFSGDVLALSSRPNLPYGELAELLSAQTPGTFLLNRALLAYPPGSVFKAFVAAVALERNLVRADEEFDCAGQYRIGSHLFRDAGSGHGKITLSEALVRSCNVTFLRVGHERLGHDGLQEATALFGFGTSTEAIGRVWADEQSGTIPATEEEGVVQIAFGQGRLSVTPLQVARGFAALANGGVLPAVRLVTAAKSPAGEVLWRPPAGQAKRVISRETARAMQEILQAVVQPDGAGTGTRAWIPQAGAAGKTGSAEGIGNHGEAVVHAWFAGYFPATAPRYVTVVMVEGGGSGGLVAAPLFRELGEAVLTATGSPGRS